MALQIWTRDMVPELMMQQGRDTARAIEGFGANIGAGLAGLADRLEKKKEEEKRITVNAKAADILYKNNPEMQKLVGLSPEMFSMLSGQDKIAHSAQAITHLTFQQAALKARREQEELENAQRFPDFAAALAETGQAPESVPAPFSNAEFDRRTAPPNFQSIMAASARTGYRPREGTLDDLTRAIASSGAPARGPKVPESRKIAGRDVVFSPDTGAFQVLQPDVASLDTEPIPQYDGDGKLLGHLHHTGKGGFVYRPNKEEAAPQPVIDPTTNQPIPGWVQIGSRVFDVRNIMQKSGLPADPNAAPATGNPPAGKRYWNPETGTLQDKPYAPSR